MDWSDFANNPAYQQMSPEDQASVKNDFWKNNVVSTPDYYNLSSDQQDSLHEAMFGAPRSNIDKARDLGHTFDEALQEFPAGATDTATMGLAKAGEKAYLGKNAPMVGDLSYEPQTTAGKISQGVGKAAGFLIGAPGKIFQGVKGLIQGAAPIAGEGAAAVAGRLAVGAGASGLGMGVASTASDIPTNLEHPALAGKNFISNTVTGSILPFVEGLPISSVGRGAIGAAIFGRGWDPQGRSTPQIIADSLIGGTMTMGYRSFELQGEPFAKFGKMSQAQYDSMKEAVKSQNADELADQVDKLTRENDAKVIIGKTATQNLLGTDLVPGKDFYMKEGTGITLSKSYINGMLDDINDSESPDDIQRHLATVTDLGKKGMLPTEKGRMLLDAIDSKQTDLANKSSTDEAQDAFDNANIQTTSTAKPKPQADPFAFLRNPDLSKLATSNGIDPNDLKAIMSQLKMKPGDANVKSIIVKMGEPEPPAKINEGYVKDLEDQVEKGEGFKTSDEAYSKAKEITDLIASQPEADKGIVSRLKGAADAFTTHGDALAEQEAGVEQQKALKGSQGTILSPKELAQEVVKRGKLNTDKTGEDYDLGKLRGLHSRKGTLMPDDFAATLVDEGKMQVPENKNPSDHLIEQLQARNERAPQPKTAARLKPVAQPTEEPSIDDWVSAHKDKISNASDIFELGNLQSERNAKEGLPDDILDKLDSASDKKWADLEGRTTQEAMVAPKPEFKAGDIKKGDMIETKTSGGPVKVTKRYQDVDGNWRFRYLKDGEAIDAPFSAVTDHEPQSKNVGAAAYGEVTATDTPPTIIERVGDALREAGRKMNAMLNWRYSMDERAGATWDKMFSDKGKGVAEALGLKTKLSDLVYPTTGTPSEKKATFGDSQYKIQHALETEQGTSYQGDKQALRDKLQDVVDNLDPKNKQERQRIVQLEATIDMLDKGLRLDNEPLTPEEQQATDIIKKMYADFPDKLREAGVPITERVNYSAHPLAKDNQGNLIQGPGKDWNTTQIYDWVHGRDAADISKEMDIGTGQMGEKGAGILQHRVFPNADEALLAGYYPSTRSIDNASNYMRETTALMAGREWLQGQMDLTDSKGKPLITDELKQASKDYEIVNILGKNYSVLSKVDGKPYASILKNEFTASPETQTPYLREAAKTNLIMKEIKTLGSMFHWREEGFRALTSGVNPLEWKEGLEKLANGDPDAIGVAKYMGLGQQGDLGDEILNKAMKNSGFSDKLAQLGQSLGAGKLFGEVIPGLKVLTAMNVLAENTRLNDAGHFGEPKTQEELYKMTADQVDQRFGIRNLNQLGRSKLLQGVLRFFSFAPDWKENEIRAIGGMFGAEGTAQLNWQLRNAVVAIATTELLNYAFTGHLTDKNKGGLAGALSVELPWLKYKDGSPAHINLMGQLAFPITAITQGPKILQSGESVISRMLSEQKSGKDWRGRPFATAEDMAHGKFYGTPGEQSVLGDIPGRALAITKGLAPIPVEAGINALTGEGTWPQAAGSEMGTTISRGRGKSISEILASGK